MTLSALHRKQSLSYLKEGILVKTGIDGSFAPDSLTVPELNILTLREGVSHFTLMGHHMLSRFEYTR